METWIARIEVAFLAPVWKLLSERFPEEAQAAVDAYASACVDGAMQMWYTADWYCEGCGRPQMGASSWPGGAKRCRGCGPGEGYVACPATHGDGGCALCKGTGYVEEIR